MLFDITLTRRSFPRARVSRTIVTATERERSWLLTIVIAFSRALDEFSQHEVNFLATARAQVDTRRAQRESFRSPGAKSLLGCCRKSRPCFRILKHWYMQVSTYIILFTYYIQTKIRTRILFSVRSQHFLSARPTVENNENRTSCENHDFAKHVKSHFCAELQLRRRVVVVRRG